MGMNYLGRNRRIYLSENLKKYAVGLVSLVIEANDNILRHKNESLLSMIASNSCEMLRNGPAKYSWSISHAVFSIKWILKIEVHWVCHSP
jgi:hypothetical protein